jgi:hypothetical protein
MGMGTAPAHAWTITKENVAKICPKEFAELDAALSGDWDAFAMAIHVDDETAYEPFMEKWTALQKAFELATATPEDGTSGYSELELSIDYYSREDGDCYDDLETGCYFTVDGVTKLTCAGIRFEQYLTESSWTVFG